MGVIQTDLLLHNKSMMMQVASDGHENVFVGVPVPGELK